MALASSSKSASPRPQEPSDREHLHEALEHAAHLLPAQAPIRIFVHHNTLHAFQHLPFDEAVVRAAEVLGTEPYESGQAFAGHLATGRITRDDLAAVLAEADVSDAPIVPGAPSVRALRLLRLEHPMERVEDAALEWLIQDGGALARFDPRVSAEARDRVLRSASRVLGAGATEAQALAATWERLSPHAPRRAAPRPGPRPRDRVLAATGHDIDEWVRPLLIRVCAAFVDQGIAYWSMPARERGLLAAFRALYANERVAIEPWRRGLARKLARQEREGYDAERTAIEALTELSIPREQWADVVEAMLRALPGWAGMIAQLEERPDRAPVKAPPARLVDYLALALLLEAQAVSHVLGAGAGIDLAKEAPEATTPRIDMALVYEAFVLAQLAGVGPAEIDTPQHARAFVHEAAAFDSIERRRSWHRAYELHHRQHVLDSLLAHARAGLVAPTTPSVQALFCIDEREESLRRHLEEIHPSIETLGYAGFYGVPMAYRGLADVHPTPLCPVVIRPKHLVVEEAIEPEEAQAAARRRRALGTVRHASDVGSKTFVRGSALAATAGLLSAVPLIGRAIFPRLSERLLHSLEHAAIGEPRTRLRIERSEGDGATTEGLLPGFTVEEMAAIVGGVLRTCGLDGRLSPLVVIVGHGSSSLNNPHEAAHDCGATGGGRGGPNARAFAAMANHPRVRDALAAEGLTIAPGTWFVGAYHNTCDDAVTWYDLDLVPQERREELERVRDAFERARRLDAHERCRRFESAPLDISPEQALAHVERRAADLGEPRPEYGHATNAICVVGRRERTRGLFLDRRPFLVSYDPTRDPDGTILGPLLASVGPVGAGINLEYYFSFVDPTGYGCGTKLPHNIVGLVGVMDGHASDLRTGLPWQMVEIHEPVRLLTIVEAEPELLERLLDSQPGVREVVLNRWIQLVAWSPSTGRMSFFSPDGFVPHEPRTDQLTTVATSLDHYRGRREHLDCARIEAGLRAEASR